MELLFFTSVDSPRVRYTADLIFGDLLGLTVSIVTDKSELANATAPLKVNYSQQPEEGMFHLFPHGLLSASGVQPVEPEVRTEDGLTMLFPVRGGRLLFDPLAAAFYMVSRYEEYLPFKKDKHGRYDPEQSLAFRQGFLQRPVVNQWAYLLRDELLTLFPKAVFPKRKYRFLPTVDVDNAYAYLEKGLMRTSGAFLRSLVNGDMDAVRKRARALAGMDHDPYDTFEQLLALQKQYSLPFVYFFLVADYGLNDKNVPVSSKKFQSLIKSVNDYSSVGVHPSYQSNEEPERLKTEIQRLGDILHQPVTQSRQHFLKLSLPHTYRNLLEADIQEDYSMGYPSEFGFRAGICDPFWFYDLDREEVTPLRVFPFCVMEATLRYYKTSGPEDAVDRMTPLIEAVREVDGLFCALWHSESLSGVHDWEGWEPVFEQLIQRALP